MHTFSNCTASWAGIDIKNSTDTGMSISMARAQPRNTFKTNGAGKLIKIRQPDDSGVLTCKLDCSSSAHTLLMAQFELETAAVFVLYDGKRWWYFQNATLHAVPLTDNDPFMWVYEKMDHQIV